MVFIATCDRYISEEESFTNMAIKMGLNEEKLEKVKKFDNYNLKNEIKPLPLSLLNFTIDFGCLSEMDKKNYIKTIIKS